MVLVAVERNDYVVRKKERGERAQYILRRCRSSNPAAADIRWWNGGGCHARPDWSGFQGIGCQKGTFGTGSGSINVRWGVLVLILMHIQIGIAYEYQIHCSETVLLLHSQCSRAKSNRAEQDSVETLCLAGVFTIMRPAIPHRYPNSTAIILLGSRVSTMCNCFPDQ